MDAKTLPTRDLILLEASNLIQTKSYSGFGFQELADAVGIRKASVYHHFASKEALALELIKKAEEIVAAVFEKAAPLSGIEQLRYVVSKMARKIGAGNKICPGVALIANWDSLPADLRESAARITELYIGKFAAVVDAGRKDGSIRKGAPSREVAMAIYAGYQGAVILARLSGNTAAYNTVMESLINTLASEQGR